MKYEWKKQEKELYGVKKLPQLVDVPKQSFVSIKGKCLQILHVGSFDAEPESFAILDQYASEKGWKRTSNVHREIYLNNARRTAKEKLHTILRYQISDKKTD